MMTKWKGGRPTAALTTDWMALDPTKPPSFILHSIPTRVEGAAAKSIEFRSGRRARGDVGGGRQILSVWIEW